jgi:hypothetical protein
MGLYRRYKPRALGIGRSLGGFNFLTVRKQLKIALNCRFAHIQRGARFPGVSLSPENAKDRAPIFQKELGRRFLCFAALGFAPLCFAPLGFACFALPALLC